MFANSSFCANTLLEERWRYSFSSPCTESYASQRMGESPRSIFPLDSSEYASGLLLSRRQSEPRFTGENCSLGPAITDVNSCRDFPTTMREIGLMSGTR